MKKSVTMSFRLLLTIVVFVVSFIVLLLLFKGLKTKIYDIFDAVKILLW